MLAGLLAEQVRVRPDARAVTTVAGALTWAELGDDVARRVAGLRNVGVDAGDRVAFVLGNGVDFVATFLAATSLGAAVVPINPSSTSAEVLRYLGRADARAVVAPPETSAAWPVDELGDRIAVVDPKALAAADADGAPPEPPSPDVVAYLGFSSGSTGTPKLVPRTHANLVAEAEGFAAGTGTGADDRILVVVPLFHAHGLGNGLLAALRTGAELVLVEQFQPKAVLAALLREHRITIWPSVPFMLQILATSRRAGPDDVPALRLCFTAGAALARETFDEFTERFGVAPRQLYGCTEAGSVTLNLDDDPSPGSASVGRPLPHASVRVVADDGAPCAPGVTGAIAISGPTLTAGYLDLPEANAESFHDGWFTTGDVGHLDDHGRLHVTGRTKLFIATGGSKVDPFEVEDVLRSHPDVREVVVVGVPGPRGDELVKAVVVPAGDTCDTAALLAHCRGRLAEYKVPRRIELRDAIPVSPLGKILRKDLVLDAPTAVPTPGEPA